MRVLLQKRVEMETKRRCVVSFCDVFFLSGMILPPSREKAIGAKGRLSSQEIK